MTTSLTLKERNMSFGVGKRTMEPIWHLLLRTKHAAFRKNHSGDVHAKNLASVEALSHKGGTSIGM